jgi:hypothetical protein
VAHEQHWYLEIVKEEEEEEEEEEAAVKDKNYLQKNWEEVTLSEP